MRAVQKVSAASQPADFPVFPGAIDLRLARNKSELLCRQAVQQLRFSANNVELIFIVDDSYVLQEALQIGPDAGRLQHSSVNCYPLSFHDSMRRPDARKH